ncbi:unnamed protein product [Brachionus calyciflorus]|uniref:Uncharacterized protein n=1 Tax=Brachionus calyciflorus TaxID=104777 RepID=A0A814N5F5_9BILA|nr:unnamed protein product [Brachionus calyciflorus]
MDYDNTEQEDLYDSGTSESSSDFEGDSFEPLNPPKVLFSQIVNPTLKNFHLTDENTITREITKFKYIVKIKEIDQKIFYHPEKLKEEIIKCKGDVKIDKAFFNKHNDYLYIFTNDEYSNEILNKPWPEKAFGKGIELIVPKKFSPK